MRGTILESQFEEGKNYYNLGSEEAHYRPSTSYVRKETKYGTFYGKAQAASDDEDIANQWDGCRFAEMKCDIKAYKAKMKLMEQRALGVQHAFTVITQSFIAQGDNDFYDNPVYLKLERQRQVAWDNYYRAKDQYELMKDSYSGFCAHIIKQRRKFRNEK